MKHKRFFPGLLLILAFLISASQAFGAESSDTAPAAAFHTPAAGEVAAPYQPVPDAESCAARAEAIGAQLDDWDKLGNEAAATRFGVSEEAVFHRKETLRALKNLYPAIVSALGRKAHIEAMLTKRQADITAPELTLAEKPPYSLNYYNAYINQLDELESQIGDAQYDLEHAAAEEDRARRQADEREAEWRLARDTFLSGNTQRAAWQLFDASFSLEAARAQQTLSALKKENAATVLATRKLARDRYVRTRAYIRDHLDLEKTSFEAQIAGLNAQAKELESRRDHLSNQYRLAQEKLEAAQQKYAASHDETRAAALRERALREDERDAARLELEHLRGQLDLLSCRRRAWNLRYDIARSRADLAHLPAHVQELRDEVRQLDEEISEAQKDMLALQGRLAAVQKHIDAGVTDSAQLPLLRKNRAVLQAAIDSCLAYSALLFDMRAQERALIEELQETYRTVPLWEKVHVWWQTQGTKILNTELWQSGGYAVRLREFVLALALIVLGNWGMQRLFALLLWGLSKKFSFDETSRRSLKRLFSCLTGVVIFLGVLRIVGIPLTAFAFLGGTIAIGVGFGTQNLFKNLISGILLAVKRPFRLGHVVEVSGIIGVVSDIGLNSTIIRTFDGKDAVIPNSDLLENQLINWNLSDALLRSTIEVGVQYGTSPKHLRKVLLAVMAANPHVLKHPEPLVRLTGYGDSELEFEAVFWVNQRRCSAYVVSCQLREDFLEAMEKDGLEMAYPHVDVNLYPHKQPSSETDESAAQ